MKAIHICAPPRGGSPSADGSLAAAPVAGAGALQSDRQLEAADEEQSSRAQGRVG